MNTNNNTKYSINNSNITTIISEPNKSEWEVKHSEINQFNNNARNNFLLELAETYKKCLDIATVKTKDYATIEDPYSNFKKSKIVANVEVENGILVRFGDKLSRILNLLNKEADVKDETIEDTINDAINYLAILKSYIKNERI